MEKTPQEKLQQHFDQFEGLVITPAQSSWIASLIQGLTRLKSANFAMAAIVAVCGLVAYKGLPGVIAGCAFVTIGIVGVVGTIRER
ncbi:hypothetical protein [Burkholderia gladioli]|uniref:hypothetical protein n=1 Tax=Burkholderia gladioli TaxID=28095 RepID=UPI00163ED6B0|nr:hypothetical protein [Burkholderia gladioli]